MVWWIKFSFGRRQARKQQALRTQQLREQVQENKLENFIESHSSISSMNSDISIKQKEIATYQLLQHQTQGFNQDSCNFKQDSDQHNRIANSEPQIIGNVQNDSSICQVDLRQREECLVEKLPVLQQQQGLIVKNKSFDNLVECATFLNRSLSDKGYEYSSFYSSQVLGQSIDGESGLNQATLGNYDRSQSFHFTSHPIDVMSSRRSSMSMSRNSFKILDDSTQTHILHTNNVSSSQCRFSLSSEYGNEETVSPFNERELPDQAGELNGGNTVLDLYHSQNSNYKHSFNFKHAKEEIFDLIQDSHISSENELSAQDLQEELNEIQSDQVMFQAIEQTFEIATKHPEVESDGAQDSPKLHNANNVQNVEHAQNAHDADSELRVASRSLSFPGTREKPSFTRRLFWLQFRRSCDTQILRLCSQPPPPLDDYKSCEEYLWQLPGGFQTIQMINKRGQQLGQKEKVMDVTQLLVFRTQLKQLLQSAFIMICDNWPQQCAPLMYEHKFSILKCLQNVIIKNVHPILITNFQDLRADEDQEIFRFCALLSQVLDMHAQQDINVKALQFHESQECVSSFNDQVLGHKRVQSDESYFNGDCGKLADEPENSSDENERDFFGGNFAQPDCQYENANNNLQNHAKNSIEQSLINKDTEKYQIQPCQSNFQSEYTFQRKNESQIQQQQQQQQLGANVLHTQQHESQLSQNITNYNEDQFVKKQQQNNHNSFTEEVAVKQYISEFELPESLKSFEFDQIIRQFQSLEFADCPIEMLACLQNVHEKIRAALSGNDFANAEDVTQTFVYGVVKSNLKSLASISHYLEYANLIDDFITSDAQVLCNLQLAIGFIQLKMKFGCEENNQNMQIDLCGNCVDGKCLLQTWLEQYQDTKKLII